jgi:hypothetical protein
VIGLLIRLVVFLVELFVLVYAVAATVSFLWGLGRFLIAAPGAIRHDLAERRARHAQPARTLRYVANEASTPRPSLPPPDGEPPALMPGPSE